MGKKSTPLGRALHTAAVETANSCRERGVQGQERKRLIAEAQQRVKEGFEAALVAVDPSSSSSNDKKPNTSNTATAERAPLQRKASKPKATAKAYPQQLWGKPRLERPFKVKQELKREPDNRRSQ